jgi:hypothetical protein
VVVHYQATNQRLRFIRAVLKLYLTSRFQRIRVLCLVVFSGLLFQSLVFRNSGGIPGFFRNLPGIPGQKTENYSIVRILQEPLDEVAALNLNNVTKYILFRHINNVGIWVKSTS